MADPPTPEQIAAAKRQMAALEEWRAGRRRFWALPPAVLFVRPESEKEREQ